MYSYITKELPQLVNDNFPVDPQRMSVFGHSMGGHGALICALKNPGKYKAYDATCLVKSYPGPQLDILIDQGKEDEFLSDGQLLPDNFIAACTEKKIPVVFRLQEASTGKPYLALNSLLKKQDSIVLFKFYFRI